jgi:hypothetical protein
MGHEPVKGFQLEVIVQQIQSVRAFRNTLRIFKVNGKRTFANLPSGAM